MTIGRGSSSRRGGPGRASFARRGRAAGFTLLELVLVLVIMATVLGMASASLRGFFAGRQTADAAVQIVALTDYARAQATAEARAYRLNVDLTEGAYWLTAQTDGPYARLPREFGREFSLPEGTTASWPEASPAPEWIPFYPDGRTEAVTLRLTGRIGDVYDVVCESPAERFHVEARSEEEGP